MSSKRQLEILIVDDSALIRGILKKVINDSTDFSVAGEASNGKMGCEKNLELKPDLIIMDINMPIMDGVTAAGKIMKERAVPIIIFSSSIDARTSFEAVSAVYLVIIEKPYIDVISSKEFIKSLSDKINAASASAAAYYNPEAQNKNEVQQGSASREGGIKAVVIGASTGGPLAVKEVLSALPASFPVGIALVQHLEENFDQGYAEWLDGLTDLKVRLAKDNDRLTPGEVLIGPVNSHLAVRANRLQLEDSPPVLNQKPAVDVLFSSASENYGKNLLAVLLTGMGRDGADGCVKIKNRGGYTLVQDQATSAIFGMPRAAIEAGGASEILALQDIPLRMMSILGVS